MFSREFSKFIPFACQKKCLPHLQNALFAIFALIAVCLITTQFTQATPEAVSTEPALSPPGGYYDRNIRLKIIPPHFGGYILFTVDGSIPTTETGTLYTGPIPLDSAIQRVIVIRARAILPDNTLGPVVSASYFMGIPATLPMMSLIMDPDDLWEPQRGIYANPYERGVDWERPVDITYVDKDRQSGFSLQAGIRIHGHQSRGVEKKSFRLYFRASYGPSRLDYPLFVDSEIHTFKRLVLHNGGQDWAHPPLLNWTLLRNQLTAQLAFELDGYATHSQPALLFINGEPWGIYQIRERIDTNFLEDHYGFTSADLLESSESNVLSETLMGDRENWDYLLQFLETNDLTDAGNYAYVQSQIDIGNFMDYYILQIYSANTDWPVHNIQQLRPRVPGGRWQWIFWDSDNGFGADTYSWVDSDMISHLLDYQHPYSNGRDTLMFRKLLQNPVFFEQFLSRTADLLNITLNPASVHAHIDALATELAPDIACETARWPSPSVWEDHIQELRDFASQRPAFIRQHIVERLGLAGTAELNFTLPDNRGGAVAVNGHVIQELPWQGIYFQGIPVQVTAIPAPGYRFAGWEPADLPQASTLTLMPQAIQTLSPRFARMDESLSQAGDVVFTACHVDDTGDIEGAWFEIQVKRLSLIHISEPTRPY